MKRTVRSLLGLGLAVLLLGCASVKSSGLPKSVQPHQGKTASRAAALGKAAAFAR